MVGAHGIQEKRVRWIDGGHREELIIVLQPVAQGAPEVTASPPVKSCEVQIIKDCKPGSSMNKKHGS